MAKLLDDSAISSGVPSPVTVSLSLATLTSRDRKASDDQLCGRCRSHHSPLGEAGGSCSGSGGAAGRALTSGLPCLTWHLGLAVPPGSLSERR